ncbi:microtubule-associated protein futsch isoform X2 [Drosophila eugracilis]|uniref:microtubule-associated protein futsch isoform X2 n=1 Tax=Drosophila eugracilis TaxID=29029 RepID=UPI001BDAD57B|nr:microtubule-associated protein futsch isoform X2 [Drosophila eugracilis]
MGDQPKATTSAIVSEGEPMMFANQDSLPNGAGGGPPQVPDQEQGQAELGDTGDDAATDAGASSLPPSEIGGRAPLDTACSDADGGAASSLAGGIVGPPSPLTGCYLLIVLGEPHSDEHKDNILQHLLKGFLSWDVSDCHVDLEEELNTITQHAPEGEEARHGERLIQYASENLVTEVLIHPQYNTLIQCMRNLLSSFTRHRHIIHAGYTFSGNGSWILQDGTFSVADFSEAFQEHDVQRVIRAYADTITMNIHCADAGLWHTLPEKAFARQCRIRINPVDVLDTSSEGINGFIDYLAPMVMPTSLRELLETSDVVGNIRFTHPTLYVFPGGQGDAALFGINGFNMLVDGGFNRKACFWDFARHLDRLDAVLMTRLNNSNVQGLGAVVSRKRDAHVYPQIGHFFGNLPDRKGLPSPDGDKDRDPLLIDLFDRGHGIVSDLRALDLKPQCCYRNQEPVNLYHKVGHGTLDMYVISPARDSKEVKEFLQKWHAGDQRLFGTRESRDFNFPLQNLVSICALLVWQPANPDDTITRILFPGSTPDFKIQEGLEKLKHLEFMKHSTCTAKSIALTIQTVAGTRKSLKSAIEGTPAPPSASYKTKFGPAASAPISVQYPHPQQQDNKAKEAAQAAAQAAAAAAIARTKADSMDTDAEPDQEGEPEPADTGDETAHVDHEPEAETEPEQEPEAEHDNKDVGEENMEVIIIKPQQAGEPAPVPTSNKDALDATPVDAATTGKPGKVSAKSKAEKPRAEVKPVVRSRIDTKPPKSMDRKIAKRDERKSSPTATPAARPNASRDAKSKVLSRPTTKSSPSSTPAKSAKDANNRKVLESKQQSSRVQVSSTASRRITGTVGERRVQQQTEAKSAATGTMQAAQRKPISRRLRGVSPSKRAPAPGSPVKQAKPKAADLKKTRLDKGGTTDSSLVSTPSADEATAARKLQDLTASQELDAEKQRELDDLKEEQEVVREIEAVFSRDEMKRQQHQQIKAELREMPAEGTGDGEDEPEEEEEYLIIEKEEVEQYTEDSIIEQESSMTKEEEIQKHQRDSQESEKKRKKSAEEEIEAAIAKVEAAERKARLESSSASAPQDESEVKTDLNQSEIKAEVQDIISIAKDIVKSRTEEQLAKPIEEEFSSPTPEEKLSKKTSDTKDELIGAPIDVLPVNLQESLPEEKFSATIESGATTAPTLPEDERIPLDHIKEDLVIEEKYVKEETKEVDAIVVATVQALPEAAPSAIKAILAATTNNTPKDARTEISGEVHDSGERVLPMKMTFEAQQNLLRDVIKTPDEVADLPVHEEADLGLYEKDSQDTGAKSISHKEESVKEEKETDDEKEKKEREVEEEASKEEPFKVGLKESAQEVVTEKVVQTCLLPGQETKEQQPELEKKKDQEFEQYTQSGIITEKELKKSASTPEEKETSDITSEDELPAQLAERTIAPSKEAKEREDTVSVESPATIEEAIEVDVQANQEDQKQDQKAETLPAETAKARKSSLDLRKTPRPESATESDNDDAEQPVKSKQSSRPESVADVSRPDSTKNDESPFPSKDVSRSQSVAESLADEAENQENQRESEDAAKSHKDENQALAYKESSRPESAFDGDKDLSISKEVLKDEIFASKEASRPGSVVESIKDEGEMSKEPSRRESIVKNEKESKSPLTSKDVSRPGSVIESVKDETEKPESRRVSIAENINPLSNMDTADPSRPESSLEHVEAESDKPDKPDNAFRRESFEKSVEGDGLKDDKPASVEDNVKDKDELCKESSRPVSAAENVIAETIKDLKSSSYENVSKQETALESGEDEAEAQETRVSTETPEKPEDETSLTKSKEGSLPRSMVGPDKDEAKKYKEPSGRESVAESVKSESIKAQQSPLASKETSRPESAVGSDKEEAERAESRRASEIASDTPEKAKDEKSGSKEVSRPESVAESAIDDAEKSKEPSGRESVAESVKSESMIDQKSPLASKETSRPESTVGSAKDEAERADSRRASEVTNDALEKAKDEKSDSKKVSRPESVAESAKDEAEKLKELSGRESVAESLKSESVKDEKSPLASKETSRPESSLGSVKDEAERAESRRASQVPSDTPEKTKDEKSGSKEVSRPESVAESAIDDAEKSKEPSGRESVAESVKSESMIDQKSPLPSKETSRPESTVGSVKDEAERAESRRASEITNDALEKAKDEKSCSKEVSRPESVAESAIDDAEKSKEPSGRESVAESVKSESMIDQKSPLASKETSRPESALGSVKDEAERAESRRASEITNDALEKAKDEKSGSKEVSRPESMAESAKDEAEKLKELSGQESVAESLKSESVRDEKSPLASKETSRPESTVGSVKDEAERAESRRASQVPSDTPEKTKDEKSGSKEVSRPQSVAESAKGEAEKLKELSGRESVAESVKSESIKDEKSPLASRETSRPESALGSVKDEAERAESRRASELSSNTPEKTEDEKSGSKEVSRPESVAESVKGEAEKLKELSGRESVAESVKSESIKDEKSPLASKETSRPESALGSVKDEAERAESRRASEVPSDTPGKAKDEKSGSKEVSRPESVVESAIDDAEQSKEPSGRESLAESVKSEGMIDQKSPLASKETSRPESTVGSDKDEAERAESRRASEVASDTPEKTKDEKSGSKEVSRPESVVEGGKDEAEKLKELSGRESVAESVKSESIKDEKSPLASKGTSRPESAVGSVKDEAERAESRRASEVASDTSEKTKDEKSRSKEVSRPESVAESAKDEAEKLKELSGRESVAESVKSESIKDEKSPLASKETSRPESALGSVKDEAERAESRRASEVPSDTPGKAKNEKSGSKEVSRPESEAGSAKDEAEKVRELSGRESVAESVKSESVKDEKSPLASKETSRPESTVGSVKDEAERAESRRASEIASDTPEKTKDEKSGSKEVSRPESVSENAKDDAEKSKEPSGRQSVAESVKSESMEDQKSPLASKETSRPESAVGSVKDDAERAKSRRASEVPSDTPEKAKDEKSGSKEVSRPESVSESAKDDAEKSREPSGRQSVAESVISESIKDEKSPLASKETSRPESAVGSDKEDAERAESRRASEVSSDALEKAKNEKSGPQEVSRPESVAESAKDEAEKDKEPSGRESVGESVETESIKDGKSLLASKEESRPESVIDSVKDNAEKLQSRRESVTETGEAEEGPDEKPSVASKEVSRPVSVAGVDDDEKSKQPETPRDEKAPVASKEVSRPESVLEAEEKTVALDDKSTLSKEAPLPEFVTSESSIESLKENIKLEAKSLSASGGESRREAVAGSILDSTENEKFGAVLKDVSVTKGVNNELENIKDKKSESIAESASSPIEEAPIEFSEIEILKRAGLVLGLQESFEGKLPTDSSPVDVADGDFSHVIASVSSVTATITKPAELSKVGVAVTVSSPVDEAPIISSALERIPRPDSAEVTSPESTKHEKSPLSSKETSRAESVAESNKDDEILMDKISTDVKNLPSTVSSKETSRPASVADTASSPIDGASEYLAQFEAEKKTLPLSMGQKGSLPTLSSPVDVAHDDFLQTSTPTSSPISVSARPAEFSVVGIENTASSPVDEAPKCLFESSVKDEVQKSDSSTTKEGSRRESFAESSQVEEEKPSEPFLQESKTESPLPESLKDEKSLMDVSGPGSVVVDQGYIEKSENIPKTSSTMDDKSPLASKEASRPESILESFKDENEKPIEASRPESVAESIKSEVDGTESRTESVAESIKEGNIKSCKEDVQSTSVVVENEEQLKKTSRNDSIAESIKADSTYGEKSPMASKDASRPGSSAESNKCETASGVMLESAVDNTTTISVKESARSASVVEDDDIANRCDSVAVSIQSDSVKDLNSPLASKEVSRPASVLECNDEISAVPYRPASVAESSRAESSKNDKSAEASKETSRPESVAESVSDDGERSKASLGQESKTEDRKESKSPFESKEVSRPGSVIESVKDESEKPESRRVSIAESSKVAIIEAPSKKSESISTSTVEPSRSSSVAERTAIEKFQEVSRRDSVTATSEKEKSPISSSSEMPTALKETSLHTLVGETASSPIEEGPQYIAGLAQPLTQMTTEARGQLPTLSSPVDVAEGEFSELQLETSSLLTTLSRPAELTQSNTAQTASSPVDEASPYPDTIEVVQEHSTPESGEAKLVESSVAEQEKIQNGEQLIAIQSKLDVQIDTVTGVCSTAVEAVEKKVQEITENVTECKQVSEQTTEVNQILTESGQDKSNLNLGSFSELRETHITTVDSPEFTVTICEREDPVLHDIKEEDEEHRFSPPSEGDKTGILPPQPIRPLSPREEEVARIVADVAKVLKSDKDIIDIIPDFDERQLEEKLKSTADTEEESDKSIKDEKFLEINVRVENESEKSSPDQKSGPISIEEKDKIEQSEKAQLRLGVSDVTHTEAEELSTSKETTETVLHSSSTTETIESKQVEGSSVELLSTTVTKSTVLSSQSIQLREESTSDSLSSSLKVEDNSRRESLSSLLAEKGGIIISTSLKEDASISASQMEELLVQSEECSSESIISEIQTNTAQKSVKETKDTKETSNFSSNSSTKDESLKETVAEFLATEKIVSTKEAFSAEATKTADECLKNATANTVSSTTTTQQPMFSGSSESRQESVLSQPSDGDKEPNDDDDERASVKESRSKSIATIMMTSIYKPSDDIESITTLAEEEHVKELVDNFTSTTSSKTTTFQESSKQISSTSTSSTSKNSSSKLESITLSQIDLQSDRHQAQCPVESVDRKTPPTAPVSPCVKPLSSTESASSVIGVGVGSVGRKCDSSAASLVSSSGPLSPKDISGKSSPGALTSESQSIPTPLGRESHTETPESSPKPTSPFPRVTKDELKSMEIQDQEQILAGAECEPDLPELHELRGLECTTALSGSTEKIITTTITTVTKVISADGKEIVTEQKTVTTTDSSEPDSEKVVVTTTRTTSESERDQILPKEVALLRGLYRASTPGSEDDDDLLLGSPRSATSYELQHSSSGVSKRSDLDADGDESQDDIPPQYGSEEHSTARSIHLLRTADPMATSFYGALPDSFDATMKPSTEPISIQGAPSGDSQSSESVESSSQTWAGHKFLDQADKDFQRALEEHVQARGAEVMSSVTSKYSYSPSKAEEVEQIVSSTAERQRFPLSDVQRSRVAESGFATVGSVVSQQEQEKADSTTTPSSTRPTTTASSTGALPKDRLEEWGKPLGLPSPAPLPVEGGADIRTTPKKERRLVATKTRLNNEKNLRKRSESPNKAGKKLAPVYVDLTYVPHNGNSYYAHVDFFKRVRARYYVFSGTEPSRQVYDALLEAKQTWEDKELEVTIIPTYDTDVLGYWVAENEELLAKHRIDLSPSASRCTINLQDHETSCSAYRLEF